MVKNWLNDKKRVLILVFIKVRCMGFVFWIEWLER